MSSHRTWFSPDSLIQEQGVDRPSPSLKLLQYNGVNYGVFIGIKEKRMGTTIYYDRVYSWVYTPSNRDDADF